VNNTESEPFEAPRPSKMNNLRKTAKALTFDIIGTVFD
jgi:hypothetical protein